MYTVRKCVWHEGQWKRPGVEKQPASALHAQMWISTDNKLLQYLTAISRIAAVPTYLLVHAYSWPGNPLPQKLSAFLRDLCPTIRGSLVLSQSVPQTALRAVLPFSQGSRSCPTDRHHTAGVTLVRILCYYTNAPYRRMMKSTRCVRCKMCNFSTSTQQYGRTLGSEV